MAKKWAKKWIKKRTKKWQTAVILGLFYCFTLQAYAASPVWQISSKKNKVYIGGTIHILSESDYPLPNVFDRAYKNCDILVFETDIAEMAQPEFNQNVLKIMRYPGRQTLKSKLSFKTFADLAQFSAQRNLDINTLNQFKPGMVMVMLTLAEAGRNGAMGTGVDEYFFIRGHKDNKPMQFFEAPMDQIRFLSTIGIGKEDEMIAYILKDVGTLSTLLPVMKKAWRTGDNNLMFESSLAPLKADYPDLYATIMVNRNQAWLPVIEQMLKTPEVEFILVGAAHLAGDQGLINQLEKKGFSAKNW